MSGWVEFLLLTVALGTSIRVAASLIHRGLDLSLWVHFLCALTWAALWVWA